MKVEGDKRSMRRTTFSQHKIRSYDCRMYHKKEATPVVRIMMMEEKRMRRKKDISRNIFEGKCNVIESHIDVFLIFICRLSGIVSKNQNITIYFLFYFYRHKNKIKKHANNSLKKFVFLSLTDQ
jgi:hypothetical protein